MSKPNIYDEEFAKRMRTITKNNFKDNASEFARAVGVAQASLSRWVKGEADPSRSNLIKIAEVAGVSLNWLATGEEDKTKQTQPLIRPDVNLLVDDNFSVIDDYRSISVSAGFGVYNDETIAEKTKVENTWLASRNLKAKDCAMFTVKGDSMYPTLKDGEEIIVNCAKKDLQEGKIYILNHQGAMWVKKIHINFNGIDLVSDNPTYPAIKLTAEEANSLNVIGQVVRSYRNF